MEYAGITIGPIWDTIKNAKKTTALWAGSYIFSYLIEKILTAIEGAGVKQNQVLIPYHDEKSTQTQAGLYPDRIIFHADNINLEDIKQIINSTLKKFADDIGEHINKDKKKADCNTIRAFIMNYVKVYVAKVTILNNDNAILKINTYLDSLELYDTNVEPVKDEENYLRTFLENVKGSFLLSKDKRIRSIVEIAACGLIESNAELKEIADKKDFDALAKKTEELLLNKETKRHPGYIAIVMADGDNMGDAIASLSQSENNNNIDANPYREFSRALHTSAEEFIRTIMEFGGEPVYAGGDDMLFFAPLLSKDGEKTIFNLIGEFQLRNMKEPIPTLSFGVSITYHKFPLYEALQASRDLLNKSKKGLKNSVSIRFLTHSGSAFELSFYKGRENNAYEKFLHLLETRIDDPGYLSSVRQKILKNHALIGTAAKNQNLIANFFTNEFNEDIHKLEQHREYLAAVRDYIHYLYHINRPNVIETVSASLRLVELYRQKGKV